MATRRELEDRFKSVKKIKQIVRAMELIAQTRLKKVRTKALSSRPYAGMIKEILLSISRRQSQSQHPLLAERDKVKVICLVAFTSDRGLCGGFNTSIYQAVDAFINEQPEAEVKIISTGKKGTAYFKRRGYEILAEYSGLEDNKELEISDDISQQISKLYRNELADAIYIIFNRFKEELFGHADINKVLPLKLDEAGRQEEKNLIEKVEHVYEPTREQVIDELVNQYVINQIYQNALESRAQEEMARMVAMKQANDSADEMLSDLQLEFNKLRQNQITTEIIEVVNAS